MYPKYGTSDGVDGFGRDGGHKISRCTLAWAGQSGGTLTGRLVEPIISQPNPTQGIYKTPKTNTNL